MTTLEKLQAMFKEGKITRREFLAQASALGFAAAVTPVEGAGVGVVAVHARASAAGSEGAAVV